MADPPGTAPRARAPQDPGAKAPATSATPANKTTSILSTTPASASPAHHATRAAQEALASHWHLAVLRGPEAGLVVPLPRSGAVGRGRILSDPEISRTHLHVRVRTGRVLLTDPGSTNGTRVRRRRGPWRRLGRKPRSCGAGTRLRMGSTLLELRSRPTCLEVAAPPGPRRTAWMALMSLAAVLVMVVVGVVALRTGNRSTMGAVAMIPMLLMVGMRVVPLLGGKRPESRSRTGWRGRRGRRPDPAAMLLAVTARTRGSSPAPRAPTAAEALRAWSGRRKRRSVLTVNDGEHLALTGPRAPEVLAWWAAQVLARGAATLSPTESGAALEWGEPSRPCRAELIAVSAGPAPSRALRVRPAPRGAPALGRQWWQAVLAACGQDTSATAAHGKPPTQVLIEEVAGEPDREVIARRWADSQPGSLPAVLGVGGDGPLRADLVADGPHALLAGTTGSGKSELLTAWLLQLALGLPPQRLSLVLVDYKGGAAFGPLAALPHTAGVLTDLDPAATQRALSSLEAEVHRRERLLLAHGAKDLASLPERLAPPRLVVVVDEFATLAVEHSDVLETLVRVAAQGRSLGIHLVLATQRPSGVVSPAIRANTTLRVCLRVLDAADSRDVLGHNGAAHLERHPGRVLVTGAGQVDPGPLQAPWCSSPEHLTWIVEEIQAAARGAQRPWRPWAEPLPGHIGRDEALALPDLLAPPGPATGVLLGLTDLPERQGLGTWWWDPAEPLLVLGAAASGRTTTLDSACLGAAAAGWGVHLCGAASAMSALKEGAPGVGTIVGAEDPRRLARLWRLAAAGQLRGCVLRLDDVDALLPAIDEALGPGEGMMLLEALVRAAPATGTALVVGGPLALASARWATPMRRRLILGASQPTQAALAGLPRGVVTGAGPGRGVLLTGAETTACQVLLPAAQEAGIGAARGPLLRRLPRRVEPAELLQGAWAVGGDGAEPIPAPSGCVLVVGPPGSGRSTALRALSSALGRGPGGADDGPLVVDDLDRAGAPVQARVEQAVAQGRQVLASATTERVAATYRGALAVLRERGDRLVLWPGLGPAAQVAGMSLKEATDPRALVLPGRGALVARGSVVPVQVVDAPAAESPPRDGRECST